MASVSFLVSRIQQFLQKPSHTGLSSDLGWVSGVCPSSLEEPHTLLSLQGNHGDHWGTKWPLGTNQLPLPETSHQNRHLLCSTEREKQWRPVNSWPWHTCTHVSPGPSTSGSRWNLLSLTVDKNPISQGSVSLPPPTGKYQQHPSLLNPASRLHDKERRRGGREGKMSPTCLCC